MKFRFLWIVIIVSVGLMAVVGATAVLATPFTSSPAPLSPAPFVQNVGQFESAVLYQLRDSQAIYWFTTNTIWVSRLNPAPDQEPVQRWDIPAANPGTQIVPFGRLSNVVSFYGANGAYPAVPVWQGIRYVNLTDSPNLELWVENGRLESSYQQSAVSYQQSAVSSQLSAVSYQQSASPLAPRPSLLAPLAPHSSTLPYSTLLGGTFPDEGEDIATDAAGYAYITGKTQSPSFPTSTITLPSAHGIDVYIARFTPDGTAADYIVWINATNALYEDYGYALDINDQGEAYVTGETRSPEFCLFFGILPGYDTSYNENSDAFVLKVSADGSQIEYCTFLGGSDWDVGRAIAADAQGNAYITGGSWSTDLPTTPDAFNTDSNGERDSYLMKLDPTGTQLLYATYLGGAAQEEIRDIGLDENGRIHLTGWTNSANLPTTPNAYEPNYQGNFDAFLFTLNPAGQPDYATYLGGSSEDRAMSLVVSGNQTLFLQGFTTSSDFYTTPAAYDTSYNGNYDTFLLQLQPNNQQLLYATYLGGGGDDLGYGLDVDETGVAYLTGQTNSADFPTTPNAYATSLAGGADAFIAQLNAAGNSLMYSTYLGGNDTDRSNAISSDGGCHVFVTGTTVSSDFPTTPNAYDTTPNGDYDAFVSKLSLIGSDQLQACFAAAPLTGPAPLSVTFTNSSVGGYQFIEWDFGDGFTSTLTNPVHLYTTPGNYTVTLTISNTTTTDSEVKMGYITAVSTQKLYLPVVMNLP